MSERAKCYVCGCPLSGSPQYVGQGLWRHRASCEPGAAKYLRNRRLARRYKALFRTKAGKNPAHKAKHGSGQIIAAGAEIGTPADSLKGGETCLRSCGRR